MNRLSRIAGPALLVLAAFAALFAALAFGGGAAAALVSDPGATVRYGLPVAKLVVNIGAAGTIGALVLAAFALSAERPEFNRALDVAAGASAVWAVSSAATGFLLFLTIYGQPVGFDARFSDLLSTFLTTTELGQAWLSTMLIAATLTVLCFAVRNPTLVAFMAVFAVAGLVPMALQGHAGGTADHDAAVTAVWLHIAFAAVWLGGLLTLVFVRSVLPAPRLRLVVERYSTLALVSFVVVVASGYVSAEIRVGSLENLATPYGLLVMVKISALVALGLFGIAHRRFLIGRIKPDAAHRGWFWWLIAAELAFMGIAFGTAAALARTATPQTETPASQLRDPSAAELLTGSPLPPPPTFERYLTLWDFDLLWILACAFGIFFYVVGVMRLRRRGDRWPVLRTVCWVAGLMLLFYITNGGVNVYEGYLFSSHMLGHMALGMMVPVLLVPAAPVTLALRTINRRSDGSRGMREWILLAVHSRYFAFLANPIFASVFFVGSLWAFYYTPLFSWATTNHIGHEWMIVHFLGAGYLFVQSLIGVDPVPSRPPYPLRLLILLGTMAFHAFFGLSLMTGSGLLLSDWYGAMGWDTGISAIDDQRAGGGIAWSVGEIPTIALAIVVAVMWARSDTRDSKRYDRKADRDGEAELTEYNEMLARRAVAERR